MLRVASYIKDNLLLVIRTRDIAPVSEKLSFADLSSDQQSSLTSSRNYSFMGKRKAKQRRIITKITLAKHL
jgi:hypothetical protein